MITVTIFVLILLAGVQGDIKIVDTPDGRMGHENCARICSGVDKDYSGWGNSGFHPGKTYKWVYITDCDFISAPVITVTSRGVYGFCPTYRIFVVIQTYLCFCLYRR